MGSFLSEESKLLIAEILSTHIGPQGIAPGASLAVWQVDEEPWTVQAGNLGLTQLGDFGHPVTEDTVFDLASLTKIATATVVARLLSGGELEESDELLTLLGHRSGLPAWEPFFERVRADHAAGQGPAPGTAEARDRILEWAVATPRTDVGAHIYSDVGFLVLEALLEEAMGQHLADLVTQRVFFPLGIGPEMGFRTVVSLELSPSQVAGIAPTEQCPWRKRVLCGEVHDDNCWTMGGIASHAGLFGTALDVANLGLAWIESIRGRNDFLEPTRARSFVTSSQPGTHAMGWDTAAPDGHSSAGSLAPSGTFGHLGFTGTSLWCAGDPPVAIALLTNRVHPSRDDPHRDKVAMHRFRAALHDAVWAGIS